MNQTIRLQYQYLQLLSGLYITLMMLTLFLCNRVTIIGGIHFVASSLVVPLAFLVSDIIAEIYGYRIMKKLIWVNVLCLILAGILIALVNILPADPVYPLNLAYSEVLAPILEVAVLAILAIPASQFINSYLLTKWKFLLNGRHFLLRSIGSTSLGFFVFTVIGFINRLYALPLEQAICFILASYAIKMVSTLVFSVPTTMIVSMLKRKEPKEVQIDKVNFNPFSVL